MKMGMYGNSGYESQDSDVLELHDGGVEIRLERRLEG
jgi:hypothetical protein